MRTLGTQLGILVACLVTSHLGQLFATVNGSVSPVWLTAGVTLSAAWLFGEIVFLPIFVASFASNWNSDIGPLGCLGVALSNILSTKIALDLCYWTAPNRDFFANIRRLMMLLILILPVTALIPALVGPSFLFFKSLYTSIPDMGFGIFTWFLGDLMGMYLIFPLFISLKEFRLPQDLRGGLELTCATISVLVLSLMVFHPESYLGRNHYPFSFLVLPPLLWLAFRFGPAWSAIGNLLLASVAIPCTVAGGGPYYSPNSHTSLVMLDVFETFCTAFAVFSAGFGVSRRRFEHRLAESESRFRLMADQAPILIWLSEGPLARTQFNRAWLEFTGLSLQDSQGEKWIAAVHPDDVQRCHDIYLHAYEMQKRFTLEYRLRRADGVYRWVHEDGVPRILEGGILEGFISSCADFTDERQVRQQLRVAKEEADRASQAKSDFVANISHEIRTPLTAILGYAELVLGSGEKSSKGAESFLRRIHTNAQHLKHLVDDVLDLSKIEAGKSEPEYCEFYLPAEMKKIVESMDAESRAKKLSLNLKIAPGTPEYILSDPTRLRQILGNVIGNAIKFTQVGKIEVLASVCPTSSATGEPLLLVTVSDTGIGMSADQIQKVFQPFMQGDSSTTRRFGGTGLGLALARKLARSLGGDVNILTSEAGKGSVFEITIRARSVSPSRGAPLRLISSEEKAMGVQDLKGSLAHTKILVAEDSPELRELIRLSLGFAGAEVEFACDGLEAVEKVSQSRYDFIYMDLQMPRLDGYRAMETIRAAGVLTPIVALTARLTKEERTQIAASGAVDCVAKPFHFEELIRVVLRYAPATAI